MIACIAETYDLARRKLPLAEVTSCLESDAPGDGKRPKRKKAKRFTSDDDDDDTMISKIQQRGATNQQSDDDDEDQPISKLAKNDKLKSRLPTPPTSLSQKPSSKCGGSVLHLFIG